jgi:iron complex transport system ATP-binding protein
MEQLKKALKVRNLSFAYEGSHVLDDVSFEVEAGTLCFLLGQNGTGKSTLLKLVAGLLRSQSGSISIFGSDNSRLSCSERARLVGYLGQQNAAVFPFTVEDVILTGRASYVDFIPKASDHLAVETAIRKAGIEHLHGRNYNELSGGEQQLVMIARLLAQNPRFLLLDEPTTYLDISNQSHLLKLLKDLVTEGMTILAVMHDPNLAFMSGDDFLFLKERKIVRSGDSVKAWDSEFLRTIYHNNLVTIPYNGRAILVPHLN